jgi:hypothetical protein
MTVTKDPGNAHGTQRVIPNHRISDEASFEAVTKDPRQVAGAYFYLQMDCLVAYAYQVSLDFFRRPQLHTDVGRGTRELLARLRAQYGNDERVPSQEQRDEIFQPLFGQSSGSPPGGQGDFPRLRDDLVGAAAAFSERVFDTGEEMLRERVRTTHRPFKDYLLGLQGDSLIWSTDDALTGVARGLAYPILHSPGISAVFGISTPPTEQWPFMEDANADKLIEEISKRVLASTNLQSGLTREGISNRQRTALRGAEALATILDFREEDADVRDLNLLITKCYTWGSSLKSLTGQTADQMTVQPAYMG